MRILIFIITIIASIGMIFGSETASAVAEESNTLDWKEPVHAVAKWLHIIAGIMWIGLLYFFNFINGHLAATYDPDSKKKVVPELMPRALYWFRWGAAWTWLTGLILLFVVFYLGGLMPEGFTSSKFEDGTVDRPANMWIHISLLIPFLTVILYDFFYKSSIGKNTRVATLISFAYIGAFIYFMSSFAYLEPSGGFGEDWAYTEPTTSWRLINIQIGAMFGTIMAFNVWFRIWPAQQRIIGAIKEGVAPNASDVGLAGLRSKHNTYMSVPLIWTMINAHTSSFLGDNALSFGNLITAEIWLLIIIALGWHIVFQLYRKSGKVKGF